MVKTVSAEQLKQILDGESDAPRMIDVREPWEFELCSIGGSENIPLNNLLGRMQELAPERPTVVICHHGARSLQAALYLDGEGFAEVMNLQGGVDEWARTIDPDMQQY